MSTGSPPPTTTGAAGTPLRIGVLLPLSAPGWVEAGRQLRAGLELAVEDVNDDGGIAGRRLELSIRDTAADPGKAVAAVDDLARSGVVALGGEYHSVVARAAAARADEHHLPFLCSSAVLDNLTDQPTQWVARIAPAQSHGWRIYADFLVRSGHQRVAVAAAASVYWASGTRILRDCISARGGTVVELDPDALGPAALCDALARTDVTAVLLLVGHPDPAVSIVRAIRGDHRVADLLVGAPAGQPELADWATMLGDDGAGIPFLRYVPEHLGPLGAKVEAAVRERLAVPPSFVAFEGYDTVAVLAEALHLSGGDRAAVADTWPRIAIDGTRGRIEFSRMPSIGVWQWAWAPVQVVDRDPVDLTSWRILHSG